MMRRTGYLVIPANAGVHCPASPPGLSALSVRKIAALDGNIAHRRCPGSPPAPHSPNYSAVFWESVDVMRRTGYLVIPAEAGIHCPAAPAALAVDDSAAS